MSRSESLNREDLKKWAKVTMLFLLPTALAFLTALQSGSTVSFALGSAYSALIASVFDLLKRYYRGETDVQK